MLMKRMIFTLLVVMVAAIGAKAQYNQGRMLVGGGANFTANTDKSKNGGTTVTNSKTTSFGLQPRFGYFVIDNLAIGAALDFGTSVTKYETNDDKDKYTSIALAPFVRYYLPQNIFFQGQFGFGSAKDKHEESNGADTEVKYNLFNWSLGVGYAAFITDNIAIEPMISYGSDILTRKDSNPKAKHIDNNFTIGVGFQIYLGK